jgi:hypothetical protein
MEDSPSWEATSNWASHEISLFYVTRIFITVATTGPYPEPDAIIP